jgi:3-deoxy-7-phosphoheptulonate synthase
MYNAIQAAQGRHTFIYGGYEVSTQGNALAHAVLRGSVNRHGEDLSNYHYEDLQRAVDMYAKRGLANPMVVVDINHNNSGKRFSEQPRIAKDILYSRNHNGDIKKYIRGLMIESYIEEGRQEVGLAKYGQSITDPCLGWEDTERLLYYIAENV